MTTQGPKPITKQKSKWEEIPLTPLQRATLAQWGAVVQMRRRVHDGTLIALVQDNIETGWHLSISFRNHRGDPARYPTWDEITHARVGLLPGDVAFVMHLPTEDEYVALHDTTFHLHQHPPKDE